jgi:hypothetical protein
MLLDLFILTTFKIKTRIPSALLNDDQWQGDHGLCQDTVSTAEDIQH